jgi:transcription termination/antitermination protein NusA
MAITEFNAAVNQIAAERGISAESVLESIEMALVSAYKKDYGEEHASDDETAKAESGDKSKDRDQPEDQVEDDQGLSAKLDPLTGEARILKDGEDVTPAGFGRIAAQTAKQVILQKIRETEKDIILEDFSEKIGTLQSGVVFRVDNGVVVIDLGKAHGILLPSEQVPSEDYPLGQRLKVLVKSVRESGRGPEVMVTRADPQFVATLFEQEVPEIASEVVKIEGIAREPGSRTKMAVSSSDDRVDPVGSCVGQKGVRVQSVIAELSGEKIDIVPFSENEAKFIASALSPAKVTDVTLNRDLKVAVVSVPEHQQSLAIGREGQNARLANRLTGWKIDIKGAAGLENVDGILDSGGEAAVVGGTWDDVIKKVREEEDAAVEEEAEAEEEAVDEEIVEETVDEVPAEESAEEAEEGPEEEPEAE